jgi:uncharacterized membrane protein
MSSTHKSSTHIHTAEIVISQVLRGGVFLSMLIIASGSVWFFLDPSSYHAPLTTLPSVIQGITQGNPRALIMMGLLLLLATPVIRVAISVTLFALEHDWLFVAITVIVLIVLAISFVLGKGGA